jgi:hypothetical protein
VRGVAAPLLATAASRLVPAGTLRGATHDPAVLAARVVAVSPWEGR